MGIEPKTDRVNVRVEPSVKKRLQKLAKRERVKLSELAYDALIDKLEWGKHWEPVRHD